MMHPSSVIKLELAIDIIVRLDVPPENIMIPSLVGGQISGVNWYLSFRIETTNVLLTFLVKGVPHVCTKNSDWI